MHVRHAATRGSLVGWLLAGAVVAMGAALGAVSAPSASGGDIPAAPPPTPVTVTLYATADAFVDNGAPNTNYGTGDMLYVALFGEFSNIEQSLARWSLSSIPAGATIQSAKVRLYLDQASGLSSVTLTLWRATASWSETGVTWNNRPGYSTVTTASAGLSDGWVEWTTTTLVQGWMAGTYSNYGGGGDGSVVGEPVHAGVPEPRAGDVAAARGDLPGADADTDADEHPDADADAHGDGHGLADAAARANEDVHGDTHADVHGARDGDEDTDADVHGDEDADHGADQDDDPHADADQDGDADANGDTEHVR
ncbi:MAG: DNRLRE domain-containing protein [Thermoanaerobaculaceae bacterium]